MSAFTALYDSCVLYPAPLRDLLMHLALTDLFRAKWSNQIHDEWINNLARNRPDLDLSVLQRTRELMNAHVRDCLVTDYESLIDSIALPDPNDRHVVAAAIKGRADVIVTKNLRDFPSDTLNKFGIEAQHPDEFVSHLLDLSLPKICRAVQLHRISLKHPPKSTSEYLGTLERQELPQTVSILKEFSDLI